MQFSTKAHGRTDASASIAVAGADERADDGAGGTLGDAEGEGADGGADGAGTLGADGPSSKKKKARTRHLCKGIHLYVLDQ